MIAWKVFQLLSVAAIVTTGVAHASSTVSMLIKVDTPVILSGEIVAGRTKDDVALKVTSPIKIDNAEVVNGKEMAFDHHGEVMDKVGLWLGDPARFPNPKVGLKGTFAVTIGCASVACTISSIKPLASANARTAQSAQPQPGVSTTPALLDAKDKFDIKGFGFPMTKVQVLALQEGRQIFKCRADAQNLAEVCYASFGDMLCESIADRAQRRCEVLGRTSPEQLAKLKTYAGRGVAEMQFQLFNGQLIKMTLIFSGITRSEADAVKQIVTDKYGPPDATEREVLRWASKGELLLLSNTGVSLVNSDLERTYVSRWNENAAKLGAAEGAASAKRKSDF